MRALDVYAGSDGDLTQRYYAALLIRGPIGVVAVNLFRAQKNSARAKVYRGGGYCGMAYDRKAWAMDNLCRALAEHGPALNIVYGWKQDTQVLFDDRPSWVLYVDLPQGQCSFHARTRGDGPDYAGDWDRIKDASVGRILRFCDAVFALAEVLS